MIDTFVAISRGVAMLALAAYLLSVVAKKHKKKLPPCETCKNCDKAKRGTFGTRIWRCGIGYGWSDSKLNYCGNYNPRSEKEGTNNE